MQAAEGSMIAWVLSVVVQFPCARSVAALYGMVEPFSVELSVLTGAAGVGLLVWTLWRRKK
jgi:hypothetical protein